MYTVQLGQFVLNLEIVLYLAAGLAGTAALRWGMKGHPEQRSGAASAALNAVILWIIVWKGSQLLFNPSEALRNPLTFLYFSGGIKGAWLAGIVAIGYLLYKLYKLGIGTSQRAELAFIASMGWATVYYIFHFIFIDSNRVYLGLNTLLSAALLVYMLIRNREDNTHKWMTAGLFLSLGKAAFAFTDDDRILALLSFSVNQMVWLTISIALLLLIGWIDKMKSKSKEG